jgi:multidrug efflux pump subunit AcrA (membrane-fusion protein)
MKTSLGMVCRGIACAAVVLGLREWAVAQTPGQSLGSGKASAVELERCRLIFPDKATLSSDLAGTLAVVAPAEGDVVQKDQQVARLRDDVAAAVFARAAKEAENDVEIRYADAAHKVAVAEHRKAVNANLRVPGTIPDIEVQRLLLAAERSRLQIEQAQHRFAVAKLSRDEAEAQLKTYRVEAPFDGVVTRVFKLEGEAVRQGDPIVELTNTNRVRVEGYISIKEVLMWNVKPGAEVKVWLDIPGVELEVEREAFMGRIVFVDVSAEPVTRQVRLWAEVANRDNILRAGLTARMAIFPDKSAPPAAVSKN